MKDRDVPALAANCLDKVQRVFQNSPDMKTSIPSVLITFALVCFGLFPRAQAVVPPPDGGYPNFNTAEGQNALFSLTTGSANTAVGWYSLFSNTDRSFNTGVGAGTLVLNIGEQNTATGAAALLLNTTGSFNTANGALALLNNTEGIQNTATGESALYSNTTGGANTAIGNSALERNTTGGANTANGVSALFSNTTGNENTATGISALSSNTTGYRNTANGRSALAFNTTGFLNTANGYQALLNNTGSGNTALGYLAGSNLTTGDDNICIGNVGVAGDGGTIRIGEPFIGATYIAGISGQTAPGGAAVFVNGDGKLGTSTSSARFKDEIKPMAEASEALFALQTVTFRYKKEIDPQGIPQFGLVAEEVEKVNPDLIIRDQEGTPHTVRYEQINAMLLNEFLKEHRKNEEQEATIARLEKQVEALTAGLQKVSAQLEANKPAPQVVNNP